MSGIISSAAMLFCLSILRERVWCQPEMKLLACMHADKPFMAA